MTTTLSTQLTAGNPGYSHGLAGNVKVAYAQCAVTATQAANDVLAMYDLPLGARVIYTILESTDLDTSTNVTLSVGDTGSATRYINASTCAQTGVSAVSTATGGIGYSNTAKTRVNVTLSAGPATTAGTVTLMQLYLVEGAASY